MTIRAATKFAMVGVGLGSVMYIVGNFLPGWVPSQMSEIAEERMLHVYFTIAEIMQGGGLLLFFLTLSSKQKAKDEGRS